MATEENTIRYGPPPSGHPLYALIGEVSMAWSHIEQMLDACISTLADVEAAMTACFTAQMMGHNPRCLTIIALAHWRGLPDVEKAAEKLRKNLFDAALDRNRAIHDILLLESRTQKPYKSHQMAKE
jgi:hypothetical protein